MKTIDQIILEDNQRVLVEELPHLLEMEVSSTVIGMAIIRGTKYATFLLAMYIKKLHGDKIIAEGKKRCKKLSGEEKKKCQQDTNKVFAEKYLNSLMHMKADCAKKFKNDPDAKKSCQNKIDIEIAKTKQIIKNNKRNGGIFQPTGSWS